MRIGHLGSHVQSEEVIIILGGVTKLNLFNTTVGDVLLLQKDGINGGIDLLLNVLNQDGPSISYTTTDFSEEVWCLEESVTGVVLFIKLFLNPTVGLLLRINAETPTFSHSYHDTVLS
jgi:hypothetical protein